MAFDNPTNHGRVEKMVALFESIMKSAQANDTPTAEILQMIEPFTTVVNTHMSGQTPPKEAQEEPVARPQPSRSLYHPRSIRAFLDAQDDDPGKLMDVLYLTTVRLDEVLTDQGKKKARRQDT